MNNQERVERAKRAERLLASDEWAGAFEAYRKVLISTLESQCGESKALEAHRMLLALQKVKQHMESLIADGQIAQADIASVKSRLRMT